MGGYDRQLLLDPDRTEADRVEHIVDVALDGVDPSVLDTAAGRREACRRHPLLFAVIYFPHHLRAAETGDQITFAELHLDLAGHALEWEQSSRTPTPRGYRDAYVAPRESGKSTWLFLILPMWAAAYQIVEFVAAFADSAAQASSHLVNFRTELEENGLLRHDFPDLCAPAERASSARRKSDSVKKIAQANGFVFAANGINNPTLGLKEGETRPQLLILDDIEKGEENYSVGDVAKRLTTLEDVILALSEYAQVIITGTVTRFGSIVHQLVQAVVSGEPEPWIDEQNIDVHYYPAVVTGDDGGHRSTWPAKWTVDYLLAVIATRAGAKNMQNQPRADNDLYWNETLIRHASRPSYVRTAVYIDGAVTAKKTSDYTAIVVASLATDPNEAVIREAVKTRLPHDKFRARVLGVIAGFPEAVELVVETNQGGDLWLSVLHDMPVPVRSVHQSDPKKTRIETLLNGYQRGLVAHDGPLPALVNEQLAYPNVVNDDTVDAAATAVIDLFGKLRPRRSRSKTASYV